jgi:chorismate-pyruvate lyase
MHLGAASGVEAVRRRVVIGAGEPSSPLIWAESHILPSRLPREFLRVLGDAPDGIGESLQQIQLESWRELLWFGLDCSPAWNDTHTQAGTSVITRLYRVITAGRPALLISESFAVAQRDGVYVLDCVS